MGGPTGIRRHSTMRRLMSDGDLADLRLRAELADHLGQLLDLPPQPQRRRQELVRLHAFPARVVADPGVPVVAAGRLQVERLALARQVIEHAPLLGIGNLLVDPRRERRPPRLPLSHLPMIAKRALRRFLLLSEDYGDRDHDQGRSLIALAQSRPSGPCRVMCRSWNASSSRARRSGPVSTGRMPPSATRAATRALARASSPGQEHVHRQAADPAGHQRGRERGVERLDHLGARVRVRDLLGGRHPRAGQQRVEGREVDRVAGVHHGDPRQRGPLFPDDQAALRVGDREHHHVGPGDRLGDAATITNGDGRPASRPPARRVRPPAHPPCRAPHRPA